MDYNETHILTKKLDTSIIASETKINSLNRATSVLKFFAVLIVSGMVASVYFGIDWWVMLISVIVLGVVFYCIGKITKFVGDFEKSVDIAKLQCSYLKSYLLENGEGWRFKNGNV